MSSRIENLIRTAVQTFATKPNGSFINANINHNIQVLCQLLSDICPVEDIGLACNAGPSRFPSQLFPSRSAPVSYMEIFENQTVSIGVFILREGACIPLHDHVGMYGILKVLHGNLNIQSYTPVDFPLQATGPAHQQQFIKAKMFPTTLLSEKDSSSAVLSPTDHNFHTIWTAGGPASFLDILAPPYDPDGTRSGGKVRDCYYYADLGSIEEASSSSDIRLLKKISCPSTFWCDSTKYQGPDIKHLHQELQ